MIVLLDTSAPTCHFALYNKGVCVTNNQWEIGRDLAEQLLNYTVEQLNSQGKGWSDISGIGLYKGPGSFTGLRIGLTVFNTLADAQGIPVVGETGDDWQAKAIQRLAQGENEQIILPFYGRDANITKPRK